MLRFNRWFAAGLLLATLLPGAAIAGKFDGVTVRVATFGGKWRDVVDKPQARSSKSSSESEAASSD